MCGITTEGQVGLMVFYPQIVSSFFQSECYFDCTIFAPTIALNSGQLVQIDCLQDCFRNPTVPKMEESTHCVNSLFTDVMFNGVCDIIPKPDDYYYNEYLGIHPLRQSYGQSAHTIRPLL